MKTAFLFASMPPLAAIDWTKLYTDPLAVAVLTAIGMLVALRFPAFKGVIAALLAKLTPSPQVPLPLVPPPVVDETVDGTLRAYLAMSKCPRLAKNEAAQKALGELWNCLRPGV